MSPAVSVPIPIYSGGLSEPALRRVGRKTDGWASDPHTIEELASIVRQIRGYRKEYGRADAPLDIVGACKDAVDIDGYRRAGDAGVTHIQTMPWVLYGLSGESVADKLLGIERFANDVIAKMR